MNKKHNLSFIAVCLALVICLCAIFYHTPWTQSAQAEETFANQETAKKWEYCSVYPHNGYENRMGKNYVKAVISYTRGEGYSSETVESIMDYDIPNLNFSENHAFAKAIAKLGNDGWEMVGEGSFREQQVLYFKRPKK
jgi:hypothetical protein